MKSKTNAERQMERLKRFPDDRMPLCKDTDTANADRKALKAYWQGEQDLDWLRQQIATNNYLPLEAVTEKRIKRLVRESCWERNK